MEVNSSVLTRTRLAIDNVTGVALPLNLLPEGYKPPDDIDIHDAISTAIDSLWSENIKQQLKILITKHIQNTQVLIDNQQEYDLNDDETGAIVYYTCDLSLFQGKTEDSVYRVLNNLLVRRVITPLWYPCLYFLLHGLQKLPSVRVEVFRALDVPLTQLSPQYKNGNTVVWSAFSSTTKDKSVLSSFSKGVNEGTWIILEVNDGRDISSFSLFPGESEVLLLPNATFFIQDILSTKMKYLTNIPKNMDVIHMVQIESHNTFSVIPRELKGGPVPNLLELLKNTTLFQLIGNRDMISVHPNTPALQFIQDLHTRGRRSVVVHHADGEPMGFVELVDIVVFTMTKLECNISSNNNTFSFQKLKNDFINLYDVTHMISGFDNSVMVHTSDATSIFESIKIMSVQHVHRIIAERTAQDSKNKIYYPISEVDFLVFLNQQFISPKCDFWLNLGKTRLSELLKLDKISVSDSDTVLVTEKVLNIFRKMVNFGGAQKPRNAICLVNEKGVFVGWLSTSNFIKMFAEEQLEGCLGEPALHYLGNKGGNIGNSLCVRESSTLVEILDILIGRKLHRLYVVDRSKKPIYVVTTNLMMRWFVKLC